MGRKDEGKRLGEGRCREVMKEGNKGKVRGRGRERREMKEENGGEGK